MPVFTLPESLPFDSSDPGAALRQLPSARAVYALYGRNSEGFEGEPYIGVTPDLRRRLERLLKPAPAQTKRLQLVSRVQRIAWRQTGSEFESLLVQFSLLEQVFGGKALERMHLRVPALIRFLGSNPYPRLTVTNRLNQRESHWAFGPFPSRVAAEHYADELLKLFLLRRCHEDLDPDPKHPGCVYSEMKMCLAPCYQGCSDARYAEEAEAVLCFLATRGESKLAVLRRERDRAAEHLEFEDAAALHAQYQRVEAVRALSPELVHSLDSLRACVLQASSNREEVAIFMYQDGEFRGPAAFSTLGMRIQNEDSGSSSLFAQPMAMLPLPEIGSDVQVAARQGSKAEARAVRDVLEARLEAALESLSLPTRGATASTTAASTTAASTTTRQAHLALLARWYYRPQQKRIGEVYFSVVAEDQSVNWPLKAILRGIGRVAGASLSTPGLGRSGLGVPGLGRSGLGVPELGRSGLGDADHAKADLARPGQASGGELGETTG